MSKKSGSGMNNPNHISESLDGKKSDPGWKIFSNMWVWGIDGWLLLLKGKNSLSCSR
jgi:hypothetical protein